MYQTKKWLCLKSDSSEVNAKVKQTFYSHLYVLKDIISWQRHLNGHYFNLGQGQGQGQGTFHWALKRHYILPILLLTNCNFLKDIQNC